MESDPTGEFEISGRGDPRRERLRQCGLKVSPVAIGVLRPDRMRGASNPATSVGEIAKYITEENLDLPSAPGPRLPIAL
jgi:hypothetical protein